VLNHIIYYLKLKNSYIGRGSSKNIIDYRTPTTAFPVQCRVAQAAKAVRTIGIKVPVCAAEHKSHKQVSILRKAT
jgi:hypothetical protein